MITISFVVISLILAFLISFAIIAGYYHTLKKNSQDVPEGLKNTDICIADGVEEIKIICK